MKDRSFSESLFLYIVTFRYKYETSVSHKVANNSSEAMLPCNSNHSLTDTDFPDLVARTGKRCTHSLLNIRSLKWRFQSLVWVRFDTECINPRKKLFSLPFNPLSSSACDKTAGSSLWVYVFIGNMLRGIGETPIMPLGVSYLDDFSREENTPFYLGLLLCFSCLLNFLGYENSAFLMLGYKSV